MEKTNIPIELKKFFWDVEFEKIDLQKDRKFILERLLNYGTFKTFSWIFSTFSSIEVENLLKTKGLYSLSKNSFYFWKKMTEEKNLWQIH